jgi:serine/threonine protein kinase
MYESFCSDADLLRRMTYTLCVAVYQGCVFFNQYLVVKFLGKGACGKVYLVMDTLDNTLYALKITQKSDFSKNSKSKGNDAKAAKNPLEDLRAEVAIMGRVAHPNMVCLKEVVDDPQRNKVLIVMNYAEGGPILPRRAIALGMMLPEDMCRCDALHAASLVPTQRALNWIHFLPPTYS